MGRENSLQKSNAPDPFSDENGLIRITENVLLDTKTDIASKAGVSLPLVQLETLGAGVSSLLPSFRTAVSTSTVNTQGLYRLANASVGDTLKVAKNGKFWGAFKTAEGKSKFAQLEKAGPLSETNTLAMPINPATVMMAAALFSIEQELGNIAEMEKQILSFLEIEKESEIEADTETLIEILSKYKYTWDNDHSVASNHKLVCDIQRTARKNILSYQKSIDAVLKEKKLFVAQANINSSLRDFQKKIKYYRLSLYAFSLASLIEVLLGGNFREEYLSEIKNEIESLSFTYRETYGKCSEYLEKMGHTSVETNMLKGIGTASNAVGKFIGSIPVIKNGPVDEFLQDSGSRIKKNAVNLEKAAVGAFTELSSPETAVFCEKLNDLILIYNRTTGICFDEKNLYLLLE